MGADATYVQSLLLTEAIRAGESPVEVGRRAGRRSRLGSRIAVDPVAGLVEEMARHGFDPAVKRDGDGVAILLGV